MIGHLGQSIDTSFYFFQSKFLLNENTNYTFVFVFDI